MISALYSERRHRIHGDEVEHVKQAVYADLLRRLRERDDLQATCTLFRFWYRIETHCRNKPRYPPHDAWEQIEICLGFGSDILSRISEADDDNPLRLIAGHPHDEAYPSPPQAPESQGAPRGWEQPLVEVAEAVFGSPDRVDEALPWLLGLMAVALSFKREEIRSEGFLVTLEGFHRLGEDALTRRVFALEALNGLISIHGYEELRPHFDFLQEALNRRIEGEAEPPRQSR